MEKGSVSNKIESKKTSKKVRALFSFKSLLFCILVLRFLS